MNEGTSLIPPNVPVPEPSGYDFITKWPVYLIGFGFMVYLGYLFFTEAVHWMRSPWAEKDGMFQAGERVPSDIFAVSPFSWRPVASRSDENCNRLPGRNRRNRPRVSSRPERRFAAFRSVSGTRKRVLSPTLENRLDLPRRNTR